MKEPTKKQEQELWELCGLSLRCPPYRDAYGRGIWDFPNGTYGDLDLDLNNLFEYAWDLAVEELCRKHRLSEQHGCMKLANLWWGNIYKCGGNKSLALFWTLYKGLLKYY